VLQPGLVKGPWTPEEDERLRGLVDAGFRHWGEVAAHLRNRTSKQCREVRGKGARGEKGGDPPSEGEGWSGARC
jgi:hypothetical protein